MLHTYSPIKVTVAAAAIRLNYLQGKFALFVIIWLKKNVPSGYGVTG